MSLASYRNSRESLGELEKSVLARVIYWRRRPAGRKKHFVSGDTTVQAKVFRVHCRSRPGYHKEIPNAAQSDAETMCQAFKLENKYLEIKLKLRNSLLTIGYCYSLSSNHMHVIAEGFCLFKSEWGNSLALK